MVSSALYRYYPSRDDLLTALIVDAYNALGAAAEHALAGPAPARERWIAACHAIRDWAVRTRTSTRWSTVPLCPATGPPMRRSAPRPGCRWRSLARQGGAGDG